MNLFGIGPLELLFVIMLTLLVLGPTRMVETVRTLGNYLGEIRRATSDIPRLISLDDDENESKRVPEKQPETNWAEKD